MSQFVNQYNTQNGMSNMGPGQSYPGNWQPDPMPQQRPNDRMIQQNVIQSAQQQGWKTYSPAPQMPALVGRWVNTFDDIKPQDVPMDGSICFFPQSDYSCIYAMVWGNNGQIIPYRFVPEKNDIQQTQAPQSANIDDLLRGYEMVSNNVVSRLDSFEKKLNDILASAKPTRVKSDKEDK